MRDRAVIVLAAGASRRFGAEDKLLADFGGRPVLSYALERARTVPASRHIVVVSSPAVGELARAAGFEIIQIDAGQGQSDSLKSGIAALADTTDTGAMIVLGDMPNVAAEDLARLMSHPMPSCFEGPNGPTVPASLPRDWFADVMRLSGDRGARGLLERIPHADRVQVSAGTLRDIDTPTDLTTEAHA